MAAIVPLWQQPAMLFQLFPVEDCNIFLQGGALRRLFAVDVVV